MTFLNKPLPAKANGKPNTNKDYQVQGWNAAEAGIDAKDCPYYATSTAEKYWLKGHKSARA
jgi:ribosome modulation factor